MPPLLPQPRRPAARFTRRSALAAMSVALAAALLAPTAQAEWAGREGPVLVRAGAGWYAAQPDGSGVSPVEPAPAGEPSPDGRRLLAREDGALWVSDADGGHRRLLWGTPDPDAGLPDTEGWIVRSAAWSPDGRRVTFVAAYHEHSEQPGEAALHVIGSDGRGERRIRHDEDGELALVRWLPGGRIVVRTDGRRVIVLRPDATGARVLARLEGVHGEPASFDFSPDGRFLVAVEDRYDRVGRRLVSRAFLKTIDVRTGAVRTLLTRSPSSWGERLVLPDATWSPSGTRIAFILNPLPARTGPRWPDPLAKVYAVRPDGTRMRLLGRIPPRAGGTPSWGWELAWSRR